VDAQIENENPPLVLCLNNMPHFLLVFILLVLSFSCKNKGKNNSKACNGNTRREVKLCIDDSKFLIDTTPILTTISGIEAIETSKVKWKTPRLDLEKKTYTITAIVDKVKKENDGDLHVRLKDNLGKYIICEAANQNCMYASGSRFFSEFIEVNDFLNSNDIEGKTVTITGVAFVDIDHGFNQKGTRNRIELHPILKISF
jgi:hypothetical protein